MLGRSGGLCEALVACPGHRGVLLHHRKRRAQGGPDTEANLLRLCIACHDWIHANPASSCELGLIVPSWADPELVTLVSAPSPSRLWNVANDEHPTDDGARTGRYLKLMRAAGFLIESEEGDDSSWVLPCGHDLKNRAS